MRMRSLQLSLVVALAAALTAGPADAQGKGNKDKKEKSRTEQVRTREFREDRRGDDRWDDRVRLERRDGRRVPPGWCIGKGNPHNTPENCGYDRSRDDRRYEDRRYEDRRYEDRRYDDRRYDDRRSRSYDEAHRAFHREHDRVCRERASQRPFDARWQLRVRTDCKAEHDRWHARAGQRH